MAVSRFRATEYKNALSMTSSHDDKLVAVTRAVLQLPIERRNIVLRRIASRLPIYGTGCSDSDFDKAMRVVLRELILRMALQDLARHLDHLLEGQLGSSSAVKSPTDRLGRAARWVKSERATGARRA